MCPFPFSKAFKTTTNNNGGGQGSTEKALICLPSTALSLFKEQGAQASSYWTSSLRPLQGQAGTQARTEDPGAWAEFTTNKARDPSELTEKQVL